MGEKFAYQNVLPRRHRTGKCPERRARESQVPASRRLSPDGHAFPAGGESHGGLASHARWFSGPPLHSYRSRSVLPLQVELLAFLFQGIQELPKFYVFFVLLVLFVLFSLGRYLGVPILRGGKGRPALYDLVDVTLLRRVRYRWRRREGPLLGHLFFDERLCLPALI